MGYCLRFESVSVSFAATTRERNVYRRLFARGPKTRNLLFKELSLNIEAGEIIALVGPNGSGKTSLLKIAAGILVPESGKTWVGGKPQPHVERRELGLMLTTRMLYEGLTGHQNLDYSAHLFGCSDPEKSIQRAIHYWGMSEFIDTPVSNYSAGMKARLAMARATLHDPQLLLLDEPSVFLDTEGMDRLKEFLQDTEATVVMTTHQAESLSQQIDRTISMSEIKVVA